MLILQIAIGILIGFNLLKYQNVLLEKTKYILTHKYTKNILKLLGFSLLGLIAFVLLSDYFSKLDQKTLLSIAKIAIPIIVISIIGKTDTSKLQNLDLSTLIPRIQPLLVFMYRVLYLTVASICIFILVSAIVYFAIFYPLTLINLSEKDTKLLSLIVIATSAILSLVTIVWFIKKSIHKIK